MTTVGSIGLNLGLNTAPLSTQIKGAAAGAQTQLNGAFKGVSVQASKAAGGIGAKFSGLFAKLGGMMAAAFALGRIKAMVSEWQALYRTQLESEIKISVTMRNATNATMEQIQAVKDLASHYQQLGVIGDELQLSGMQELATYVKEVESVKKLMPVLNDMVAQQYGYDATGGSAVGIATMLGKVMNGSTTALSRYGYDFTEAQANIIKYGTEAEKVATVTEVIEASVANMNEALAQTPTGKAKQLSNNFGDLKESLGSLTINLCAPFISMLNVIVVKLTQAFNALSRFTAAILNIKSFSFLGLGKSADKASGSIDGIAKSAAGAGKAVTKSLMGFDQLNRLDSHDGGSGGGGADEESLPFSGQDVEELNEFAAKVKYIKALFAEGFKIGFASADLQSIRNHAESVRQALAGIFASDEVRTASKSFSDSVIKNLGKITGAIGSIGATLAENFLGGVDVFLQKRGDSLRSSIAGLFDIRTEIANTAGDLFAAFGEIFSAWKSQGGKEITASVLSVFTDMKLHITATLSKVGRDAFGALAKPFIENAVSMKATAEQVLKPIGEIFSVIADYYHEMCGVFQVGYDSFVKPIFDALGDALSKLWQSHLQPMWSKIAGFLGRVGELLKAAWDKAQPLISVIKAILGVLGQLFAPIAELFGELLASGFGRIFDTIGMVFDVLSGLIDFVVGVFTGDWEGAWQGIKNAASAVWEWLKSSFSSVGDIFGGVWQALKNGASAAWNGIKSVFSSVASFFENIFKGAWEKVKAVFSAGGKIFSGIKDGIVSAFKSIVNKIISGINTVVAVPFNGINAALKKIKGISIFGLKPFSWVSTIGVPKIPMLAQGGYVKANTPQLAMIGDNQRYGEIVAPENKMLEMILTALKMFSQQNPPPKPHDNEESQLIELVVNLGDETLMRKIIKLLREEQRRGNYVFSV